MLSSKIILSIQFLIMSGAVFAQGLEKKVDLRGIWKFNIGNRHEWAASDFDDSRWETIRVPGEWENQGFNGYDGYAWYRTTFDGTKLKDEKDVYINLGYIDDADEVYMNGQLVGLSGQFPPEFQTAYRAKREYYVPIELINIRGQNTLAVKVYDTVHGGGIISGNVGLYTPKRLMGNALILEGIWRFEYGDEREWRDADYDDSNWGHKMVPSFWTSKHGDIEDYYSSKWGDEMTYAWYRKTFRLPGKFSEKSMSIVLGRIDDFDEVYINGRFIGETNDGRRYGSSESYRRKRVYEIPGEYLNSGINIIAVRVTDMGGEAGIYEGPIGIVESQNVSEFLRWGW